MSNIQSRFDDLCHLARELRFLESTLALLEWDQQTCLPKRGGSYRADQITFLSGQIHRRRTDPRLGELLGELAESDLVADPHSDTGATVLELKRSYDKKIKLPQSLVENLARACSVGQQVWVDARKENNFSKFAPNLKEIFQLKCQEAQALGYDDEPYDALLDEYEPGARTADVRQVLSNLKNDLVPLIAEIAESGRSPDINILRRNYPLGAQEKFCKYATSKIGFDYDRGRLDVAPHPFCMEIGPDDVRMTTRYDESFFNSAFFGTLHEAGHGMYEQGLRGDYYGLAPGQYCSLGIHESQSRFWENLVGRSHQFWNYFFREAQGCFGQSLADVPLEKFYAAVNDVRPSLIRVEADEATYNLHIIIRFQLEQDIINGNLDTSNLPSAWNDKYQEYLGIRPSTDASGVLQDIHWSAGLIGYFPTYTLGNLYASQLFEAAEKELGELGDMFIRGEFHPLKEWLTKAIFLRGRCFRSAELGPLVTGNPLSHRPLIGHLRQKLSPIYGL